MSTAIAEPVGLSPRQIEKVMGRSFAHPGRRMPHEVARKKIAEHIAGEIVRLQSELANLRAWQIRETTKPMIPAPLKRNANGKSRHPQIGGSATSQGGTDAECHPAPG